MRDNSLSAIAQCPRLDREVRPQATRGVKKFRSLSLRREHVPSCRSTSALAKPQEGDIMKSRLLAMFAVLGLLASAVAAVTPVHAAVFTGFAHSDNNIENGSQ